jgi:acid stress-induced BolA-like protein IbaG/YrbA
MEVEAVKQMILTAIPDAQISVDGEDCSFTVTVVSNDFSGKLPVARQKMVMAPFKEQLASGELHALSVRAMTPDEQA